ncbi:MAG: flagellin [Candidatus Kapabacteria bacterium]|nr:flagellin [Candidatus Kapabacteria bacterium]
MAYAVGGNARIRTNIAAQNAYNALDTSAKDISLRQLRLSTGKRINNAADDVAGYITSRALSARNGSLKASLKAVGDAQNSSYIIMDSLENIGDLLNSIKSNVATAASGAMGTDEKVALAKAAYRLVQQVQTVVSSTVFGGRQLIDGTFSADFVIGTMANHNLLTLAVDLTTNNVDFNVESNNFDLNSLNVSSFGGVSGLDMNVFNNVSSTDLGIFSKGSIGQTLLSLAHAIDNVSKVASYVGGVVNRLDSQEVIINSQIVNYNAAISRIEDSDVAKEQLELVKSQFLQNASLSSLTQANQNTQAFLQLLQR